MIIYNDSYKVYAHINKINGKIYVGITKRELEDRWKNGEGYKDSPKFYHAIQKYGWYNFDHELIAANLTEEEVCNMERLLIKNFDLTNTKFGYNITEGGFRCKLSEETKIKIGNALRGRTYSEAKRKMYSLAHKGKNLTPEQIAKISAANKKPHTEEWSANIRKSFEKYRGENHWNYGKHLSEEHKQKMIAGSKKYREAHKDVNAKQWKMVLCKETNICYKNIETAANVLGICRSSISECASGKRKTAGGYHWEFVEKPRD